MFWIVAALLVYNFSKTLFCLGTKFKEADGKLFDRSWISFCFNGYLPTLNEPVSELEKCSAADFSILSCFPNLWYINLTNNYTNKIFSGDHALLNITKLWNGYNLYESKGFWEKFKNMYLVTTVENPSSKRFVWTRNGFTQHCYEKEICKCTCVLYVYLMLLYFY